MVPTRIPRFDPDSVIPIYPSLFLGALLLSTLMENWAPLPAIWRPLLIAIGVVLIVQFVMSRYGNRDVVAYFVALFGIAALNLIGGLLVLVSAALPLIWLSIRNRRIAALDWVRLSRFLNVMAIFTMAATLVSAWNEGLSLAARPIEAPTTVQSDTNPDIYLILLDGYPRSDILLRDVGLDNAGFLDGMRDLGFDVAESSRSNYVLTPLSVASVLNGRHIQDLLPSPGPDLRAQARQLSGIINDGAAVAVARRLGYSVISIPSPVDYVTLFEADRLLNAGYLTSFEWRLLQGGFAWGIAPGVQADWFRDQHRERVVGAFKTLGELAGEPLDKPRLIFAHVLAPHPPFVFGADGSPADRAECFWVRCTFVSPLTDDLKHAVAAEVSYINQLVTKTAAAIVSESRRPAVIVIFSDHGMRHDDNDRDEMLRSLLLTRTPDRPGLFPTDATPINILPRILNAYWNAQMQFASEESYWISLEGGANGFFPLTRVFGP